jgi:hypothetical protein
MKFMNLRRAKDIAQFEALFVIPCSTIKKREGRDGERKEGREGERKEGRKKGKKEGRAHKLSIIQLNSCFFYSTGT